MCAGSSPPAAPLLSGDVAMRAQRTAGILALGGALWSGCNTGAHRFSQNHWYLEEGPTPHTPVGARSATTLRTLPPSAPNPAGHVSTGARSSATRSPGWTDAGPAPLHKGASSSPVEAEEPYKENLRALASRALM